MCCTSRTAIHKPWFVAPQGFLEGVKTKDKAILKMVKMGFKYPGAEKNTVTDISLYCTLSSRVVVHGANGAGKSTMIKVQGVEQDEKCSAEGSHLPSEY